MSTEVWHTLVCERTKTAIGLDEENPTHEDQGLLVYATEDAAIEAATSMTQRCKRPVIAVPLGDVVYDGVGEYWVNT